MRQQMDLEGFMLSGINQIEKEIPHGLTYMQNLKKTKKTKKKTKNELKDIENKWRLSKGREISLYQGIKRCKPLAYDN